MFLTTLSTIGLLIAAAQDPLPRFRAAIDSVVAAYNASDCERIQRRFTSEMRSAFGPERCGAFFADLSAQMGRIVKVGEPRFVPPNQGIAAAHFERGLVDMKVVLDGQDRIAGLWFLPHTPDIPAPDANVTELSFPLRGRWLVVWGGDTREVNQHHDVPNQRHAFDFLRVDEEGRKRTGDGSRNEDYHAWSAEVQAPADGVVTDVIDGVRDNLPGSMNPYSALGNAVLIRHAEHEVSVLAHLQLGSITVEPGDRVRKGQGIAKVGNSGNSSEPHLHYHLQNTSILQDAKGIKVYFRDLVVVREGEETRPAAHSPVKGEIVGPSGG